MSNDNGVSWQDENTEYLEEKLTNAYIMDVRAGEDGTLGIIYDDYEDELSTEGEDERENLSKDAEELQEGREDENSEEFSEEADSAFNLSPECALVKADGTVIPVSLSLTEDEMYANRMWMTKEGRTFVTTLGNIIYEVKEDGSSEEFLTMEGRPMLIQFGENIMLIDG